MLSNSAPWPLVTTPTNRGDSAFSYRTAATFPTSAPWTMMMMSDRYEDGWELTEEGLELVADMVVELATRGYSLENPADVHDAASFLIANGHSEFSLNETKVMLIVGHGPQLLRMLKEDMDEQT